MRCQRCAFENPPSQSRCFRCGSILEGGTVEVQVYPPRMAHWKRPLRGLIRLGRVSLSFTKRSPAAARDRASSVPKGWSLQEALEDGTVGSALSILPGLGHLVRGGFKQILLWWLLWLGCLAAGVFVYGSGLAFPLLGLAMVFHAWIALSCGLWRTLSSVTEKFLALTLCIAVLAMAYRVPLWVTGLSWVPSTLTIPASAVNEGDYLVMRRWSAGRAPLARGTIVWFSANVYWGGQGGGTFVSTTGQVIGLPGDTVTVKGTVFEVNGRVLPYEQFPVPGWLRGKEVTIRVPTTGYFVGTPYQVQGHGMGFAIDGKMIHDMTVVQATDIQRRAILRWWPLSRRGWLKVE